MATNKTQEQIYNEFITVRNAYYNVKESSDSVFSKVGAYLTYAMKSTKLLWQLGSAKERFALILGIVANILSRVAKITAIVAIVFSIIFLVANVILFIFFFVDGFHSFPEASKFLCTWLPSGLQPSHDFLIGYTRIVAWVLTAVAMFPLWIGYNRVFDNYEDCQDDENNNVQTKTTNAMGFILAITVLTTLLLGLIWFLCCYMNLEIWTLVKNKTIIVTGLLGLGLIVSAFNGDGISSDPEEFISVLIPKRWFDEQ